MIKSKETFKVYKIENGEREFLEETPYHSQAIIHYLKRNGYDSPILIQNRRNGITTVVVMGNRGLTFEVIPSLLHHRRFVRDFVYPAIYELEPTYFEVNIEEKGVNVIVDDNRVYIEDYLFTRITIADIIQSLGGFYAHIYRD